MEMRLRRGQGYRAAVIDARSSCDSRGRLLFVFFVKWFSLLFRYLEHVVKTFRPKFLDARDMGWVNLSYLELKRKRNKIKLLIIRDHW